MTGLLRRSKPWISSAIVDTDNTSCKSKLAKVLCKTNRPYSNGKAVKLVSDGELFIVAIFTDEAVSAALTDHGLDSETGWNSALLILHSFSIELKLQPGQDVGEYVLYVEKFNIWDLQPGYTAKYDVKFCMENENVWDKMVSTLRNQREKEIEQGNTTTASSAPLTQLLEEMAQFTPQFTQQCEEEPVDSKPDSPDFTESMIEKFLQPFTSEEFLVRPAEAQILDDIQEWKDDYCPPASVPVDSDPIAACEEEFDICAGNTLNSKGEHADHLNQAVAVLYGPKVAGKVRLQSSQNVNYLGLAVTSPTSPDKNNKNVVVGVDDIRKPDQIDEPRNALFTQNDVDTQSQAMSSQWQNDLDSVRFSFEEDSCSQNTSCSQVLDSGDQIIEESHKSQPSKGLPDAQTSEPADLQLSEVSSSAELSEEFPCVLLSEKFTGAQQSISAEVEMSEELASEKPCEEVPGAQRSDAQLSENLAGAQLLEKLPGTQLSEDLAATQLSEDLPGAQLSEDKSCAQLLEDFPGAKLSEDIPGAQLSEDIPGAQLSEDIPGAQLSEDIPDAQLPEDIPGAQLSEDIPDAQLSEDIPGAQLSEDIPDAQLSKDLPGAQLSEDLPSAQLSEELLDGQLSEDLHGTQLSKKYPNSPMSKMKAITNGAQLSEELLDGQLSEDLHGTQLSTKYPNSPMSKMKAITNGAQLSEELLDGQLSEDLHGTQLSKKYPNSPMSKMKAITNGAKLSEELLDGQLSEDLHGTQLSTKYPNSPMSKMIAITNMPHDVQSSERKGIRNLRDMLNIYEKPIEESFQNSEPKSKHCSLPENEIMPSQEYVYTFCNKDTAMIVDRCYKGSDNHSEPCRETCTPDCCELLAAAAAADSQVVQLADFSESHDELGTPQAQSTQMIDDAFDGYTEIRVKTEPDQCSDRQDYTDTVFNPSIENIFTEKPMTDNCSFVRQTDNSGDIQIKDEMFDPEYDEHVSCSTCSPPERAQVSKSEDKSVMNEYYSSSQESSNFCHRWDNRLYLIGETKKRLTAISEKLKSMLGDAEDTGNNSADISLVIDSLSNDDLPVVEGDDKAVTKTIADRVCKENVGPELVQHYVEESAVGRNTEKKVSEVPMHGEQIVSQEMGNLVRVDLVKKPNISDTVESSDTGYPSFSLSTQPSTLENCTNNINSQPVPAVDREDFDQTNLEDIDEIHKQVIDNYERSKHSSIEIRDCYVKLIRIETTKGQLGKACAPKCFDTESGSERRSKKLCAKVLKAWKTDMNVSKDTERNNHIITNVARVSRDRVNSNEERYVDGKERLRKRKECQMGNTPEKEFNTELIEVNNKINSKTLPVIPFAVSGIATIKKKDISLNLEHQSTKTTKDNSEAKRNIYPAIIRWEDRRIKRKKDSYKYASHNEASGSKNNKDSDKNMKQFNRHGDNSLKGPLKTKIDMESIKLKSSEQFEITNKSDKHVAFMGNSVDDDLVKYLTSKSESLSKQNVTSEIFDNVVSDGNMSVKIPECIDQNQDVEQNKSKDNEGIAPGTNTQDETNSKYCYGTKSTSIDQTNTMERAKKGKKGSPVNKVKLQTCLRKIVSSDGARHNDEECTQVGAGESRTALDKNALHVSSSKLLSVETDTQQSDGSNNCDDFEFIGCTQPFKVNENGSESVMCTQPFKVNEFPETQEFSPNLETVDKEKPKHSSSLNTFENNISRESVTFNLKSVSTAQLNKENHTNDSYHSIREKNPETCLNVTDKLEAENLSSQSHDLFRDSSPESEKMLKHDNIGIIKSKVVANKNETRFTANSVRNILLEENRNTSSSKCKENRAKEKIEKERSKDVLPHVKESESIEEISNVVPDRVFTKLLPKTKTLNEQFLPIPKPNKTVFKVKPIVRKNSASSTKRKFEVTGVGMESDNENKRKRVESKECFEDTNRQLMSDNKKSMIGHFHLEKPTEHSLGNSFEEFDFKSSSAPKQTKTVHEPVFTSSSHSSDTKMKCKDRTNRRKFKLSCANDNNEKSETSSENVALLFAKKDGMYRFYREKDDSAQRGHNRKDSYPFKWQYSTNMRTYERRYTNSKPLGKQRSASVDKSEFVKDWLLRQSNITSPPSQSTATHSPEQLNEEANNDGFKTRTAESHQDISATHGKNLATSNVNTVINIQAKDDSSDSISSMSSERGGHDNDSGRLSALDSYLKKFKSGWRKARQKKKMEFKSILKDKAFNQQCLNSKDNY